LHIKNLTAQTLMILGWQKPACHGPVLGDEPGTDQAWGASYSQVSLAEVVEGALTKFLMWDGTAGENCMGKPKTMRVAFLHIAPRYDDVAYNVRLLEALFRQAAALQADLVLTPELAVSGYEFHPALGQEWVQTDAPAILEHFCRLAAELRTALVLGSPIFDIPSGKFHNAAIFIDEHGQVLGAHHKILVLPGKVEGWATPGSRANPVTWRGYKIGLMICADAYSGRLGTELAGQGAQVFISLAAWAPGEHAPSGEWEQRSQETGLPVLVCNRTGQGATLNFEGSSSVVVAGGRRVAEYAGKSPTILTMDFDTGWEPQSAYFSTHTIESET
jgi:5-aminopentanamidase